MLAFAVVLNSTPNTSKISTDVDQKQPQLPYTSVVDLGQKLPCYDKRRESAENLLPDVQMWV